MGIVRGPNVINDELVFGYDTGYGVADNATSTRFYPGEPADNLLFKTGAVNLTTGGDIYVNAVKTSLGNGRYKFVNDSTGSTTIRLYCNVSDLTDGQSYAISVFYEELVGSISADWCDTTLTNYNNNNGRIIGIGTRSTYTSTYRFLDINLSNGGSVILSNPQVESNSHQTPFVDGTRSDTASLIDLKRTTNIDVANVSFDSTGQPIFDGTNDHITGVLPINGNGSPHTIEMVFSSNVNQGSLGGRKDPFTIGNSTTHQYSALDVNTTNMNWYFYSKDTTFTNSPQMVANQYYHIVLSYAGGYSNNTNKKVWINGIQQTLSAGVNETPLLPNNPSFSVGRDRGRNTAYWPGKVPVFKVYDRALTQEEAQQNYKAYKNRFNL